MMSNTFIFLTPQLNELNSEHLSLADWIERKRERGDLASQFPSFSQISPPLPQTEPSWIARLLKEGERERKKKRERDFDHLYEC